MRYIWDDAPLEIPEGMLMVCVYADTTGLYTPDEVDECNLAYLLFPKKIVDEWFYTKCAENYPFDWTTEDWLRHNAADDSLGLCNFARKRGFNPRREGSL